MNGEDTEPTAAQAPQRTTGAQGTPPEGQTHRAHPGGEESTRDQAREQLSDREERHT